jgi:hypothetical protein
MLPVAEPSDAARGSLVRLSSPARNIVTVTPQPSFSLSASAEDMPFLAEDAEVVAFDDAESRFPAPAALTDNESDGDSFITSAFKRTGSSIVKTGVKTGASIFDAVRVLGGAVRKALPN